MIKTDLEELVARHEGYRSMPYRCPAGKLTIGYGYNLDAAMPEDEAHLLMRHRLTKLMVRMEQEYVWFHGLSEARKEVLLSMAYQMGMDGLKKFQQMLMFCKNGSYYQAALAMLDSKWARHDSPARAQELAEMMRAG